MPAREGRETRGQLPSERSEIRLGEAVDVTFYVTNTGTQPFYLARGGASRGVRADRFQFWAVDLEGTPAPDPNPRPGHFGRKQCLPAKVAPGGGYSEKLDLSCWVKFEQPGNISCADGT